MDTSAELDIDVVGERRRLIAAAATALRKCGRPVTTCTLQEAIRQQLGVDLTYREIIDARRPQ